MASDSDEELPSGSDYTGSDYSDAEEAEAPPSRPAAKKRRVEGTSAAAESLGLELLQQGGADQRSGGAAGTAQAAADIDGSQEAEASLLHLEVEELLKEARPDCGLEGALLQLLHQLAALLRALPQAEVAASESAAIAGFLSDLAYQPVVSTQHSAGHCIVQCMGQCRFCRSAVQ